jgi:hypothetical protein
MAKAVCAFTATARLRKPRRTSPPHIRAACGFVADEYDDGTVMLTPPPARPATV